ncbi:LysM peptidoglycan-binding domain-containing protein [Georgenia yuyongxinii]|uniref:LysM peptidoglycan-binding domain-containing protein n=1 Tax=Georgenia yuyongxinii TaxID=2589797 RepID=A0A5B8C8M2_9MICO|nr:LysM peptidoglycan-binding domain-containing protein [Georgenia yuyongxinii]QDC24316.1 LysM peptidoglycan-binding domain-containing protein [Georgenia yuyongxinii]
MSALVVQPVWQPSTVRPARRRPASTQPARRGNLLLVGPGFVPQPAPSGTASSSVVPASAARRPASVTRSRLRLTPLGRGIVAGMALVLASGLAIGVGTAAGRAVSAAPSVDDVATVTVAAGENLWTVASAASVPGADVRELVAEIAALNELGTHELRAGQQLLVPTH